MKQNAAAPDRRLAFTAGGLCVGAVLAFLVRPSVPLVGQLPLLTVLTRGGNLSGLDQLLVPTAEQSFNQMLFGAILGAAAGLVAALFLRRTASDTT